MRVGAAYAAVAWGVVVVAAELTQILELPLWLPRAVLVAAAVGFPLALVLAWAFEVTPEGIRRDAPGRRPAPRGSLHRPILAAAAAALVIVVLVGLLRDGGVSPGDGTPVPLDADLIAFMPFQFEGPANMQHLKDGGIQVLLVQRFTGEVGPRAVDAIATAHRYDAKSAANPGRGREVAAELGAGLYVTGSGVAGPDGLASLSAILRNTTTDSILATASEQGAVDSMTPVVERLAAELLSLSVGSFEESLSQLTSADWDAQQHFLRGWVDFGAGRLADAHAQFARAVEIDTTFALASIWMADAGNNVVEAIETADNARALLHAWRHVDRLSDRDSVYLRARLGPNHPDPSTRDEQQDAYENARRLNPGRASAWYFLGENILHRPQDRETYDRALQYFEGATALDPRNANALLHQVLAGFRRGDVQQSLDAAENLAGLDSTNTSMRQLARWIRAVAERDTGRATALYDSVAELSSVQALPLIFMDMPALMVGEWQIDPLVRAFDRLERDLIPGTSPAAHHLHLYYAFQDLGRPRRALQALAAHEEATGTVNHRSRLLDAIYGALPEKVGAASAVAVEDSLERLDDEGWLRPSSYGEDFQAWPVAVSARTALELWRITHGDLSGVDEAARRYRSLQPHHAEAHRKSLEAHALLLEAMAQVRRGDDEAARATVQGMDSLFLQGLPGLETDTYDAMVLATADTYERLGDLHIALRVLERESNFGLRMPFGARFARERGRLAALIGDTARAIEEYEFYTIMRAKPEPEVLAEVDEVRAALEVLQAGTGDPSR